MGFFKVWEWPQKIISLVLAILMLVISYYIIDWLLERHYNAELNLKVESATKVANDAIAVRTVENLKRTNEALKNENLRISSNLASAVTASDERSKLRDTLRIGNDRASATLSTCIQNTNTLSGLFDSVSEFAARTAKEANGHVDDKITCKEGWPK